MSLFFAFVFYISIATMIIGLGYKIRQYWRTETPYSIPITPAPSTFIGVILRISSEVLFFKSLFKANKWIWLFGWVFHASLVLILTHHLVYFLQQPPTWLYQLQPYSQIAGYTMLISLSGLLIRRFAVDRVRYISSPSDFLMLFVFIAIGSSGLLMLQLWPPNTFMVQQYITGLLRLTLNPLPEHFLLYLHLMLVFGILFIFPFSKLLHAPGVFFSPTLNQRDKARKNRHQSSKTRNP